jgi:hypothetical protein
LLIRGVWGCLFLLQAFSPYCNCSTATPHLHETMDRLVQFDEVRFSLLCLRFPPYVLLTFSWPSAVDEFDLYGFRLYVYTLRVQLAYGKAPKIHSRTNAHVCVASLLCRCRNACNSTSMLFTGKLYMYIYIYVLIVHPRMVVPSDIWINPSTQTVQFAQVHSGIITCKLCNVWWCAFLCIIFADIGNPSHIRDAQSLFSAVTMKQVSVCNLPWFQNKTRANREFKKDRRERFVPSNKLFLPFHTVYFTHLIHVECSLNHAECSLNHAICSLKLCWMFPKTRWMFAKTVLNVRVHWGKSMIANARSSTSENFSPSVN